jgi:hypothetical protein
LATNEIFQLQTLQTFIIVDITGIMIQSKIRKINPSTIIFKPMNVVNWISCRRAQPARTNQHALADQVATISMAISPRR